MASLTLYPSSTSINATISGLATSFDRARIYNWSINGSFIKSSTSPAYAGSHSTVLSGLSPNTSYNISVDICDSLDGRVFTTLSGYATTTASGNFSFGPVDITGTTVNFSGSFSGGETSYTKRRVVDMWLSNGLIIKTWSTNVGGSASSFSTAQMGYYIGETLYNGPISGLTPDTTYSWSATLCEIADDGSITATSHVLNGSFTTKKEEFFWTYAGLDSNGTPIYGTSKIKGYGIYVTASEWNELVRVVNSLYGSSIANVSTGTPITAKIYNSVASVLGVSLVEAGKTEIAASHFNLLMNALK